MSTIIFDFDGTLLDSRIRHTKVLYDVAKEILNDKNINFEDYLTCKSDGLNTIEYLVNMKGVSIETAKRISRNWISLIENPLYLKYDILYKDSKETLKKIYKQNKLVLLSARTKKDELFRQVEKNDLMIYFDNIMCIPPINAKEGKIEAARYIDNLSLVVGDTEIDAAVAERYNVPFYALNRGFRSEKFWSSYRVNSHEDFSDILEYVII